MRVLEIGKFYPPDRGGMESSLRELCTGLAQRDHELHAIVAAGRAGAGRSRDGEVVVERLPRWGTVRSVPLCPGLPGALRRARRELDPHVVHLHLPNPLAGASWLLAGDRRPLVVSWHSDIVRQRALAAVWGPWRRRLLGRASAIVTSSEALAERSRALAPFADRVQVIPLAVDERKVAEPAPGAVARARERAGGRYLLFVGRHVYYKGLPTLLEALRELPGVPLLVAGDGPLRESWETQSRVWGLADRVHFLGEVEDDELRGLYQGCEFLVLPSVAPSETFGLVQLEAMACRRPVVASRASGGVESIHVAGETGLLVAPGDPAALREAIGSLWGDPVRCERMGRAARARVEAFFTRPRHLDRWEQLLAAVSSPSTGGPGLG